MSIHKRRRSTLENNQLYQNHGIKKKYMANWYTEYTEKIESKIGAMLRGK
jgi:hypothetical protein